jgi:hypothetical protein
MWRKSLDTVHLGNERLTGDRSHTRVDKRNALRYLTCPRPREFGASESNTMLSSSRDALWFSAGVGKAFLDAWPVFRSECRTSRCRRSRCSGEIRQKRFTGGQGTGNSSLGTGHIRGRTKATPLISDLSPFYLAEARFTGDRSIRERLTWDRSHTTWDRSDTRADKRGRTNATLSDV